MSRAWRNEIRRGKSADMKEHNESTARGVRREIEFLSSSLTPAEYKVLHVHIILLVSRVDVTKDRTTSSTS